MPVLYSQNVNSVSQRHDKTAQRNVEEETIVNNIRFTPISPHNSRSSTLKHNTSSGNLSANLVRADNTDSTRHNQNHKLTKHNSLLFHSGRRPSMAKRFAEKDAFRRKSVAATALDSRPALSRSASKWSLRRDSSINAQWKGIRWKPFKKDDVYTINTADSMMTGNESQSRSGAIASFPVDEYATFVNQMFNSSVEELSPSNLLYSVNNKKTDDKRTKSESVECDNKIRKSARRSSLNLSLQDSLV